VQHVALESRSLLGFRGNPWRLRIEGASVWGSARDGFYTAPTSPCTLTLRAWPRFSQSFALVPTGTGTAQSLRDEGDRDAFRKWFIALLEQQLEGPSPAWEPAQRDCAGLLRFAFREAWGPHTEAWRDRVGFASSPVAGEPDLRRAGPWLRAFPTPDGWQPFAKSAFLRQYACVPVSREVFDAKPGDLVFFARGGARSQPDHAMVFVRPDIDGNPVLLYHTGPEGSGATRREGEVRRVRLDELMHHPEPEFRPVPENRAFLGVFRWIVLADMNEGGPPSLFAPSSSPLVLPHAVTGQSPAIASDLNARPLLQTVRDARTSGRT
jgi:hypothetical protein